MHFFAFQRDYFACYINSVREMGLLVNWGWLGLIQKLVFNKSSNSFAKAPLETKILEFLLKKCQQFNQNFSFEMSSFLPASNLNFKNFLKKATK